MPLLLVPVQRRPEGDRLPGLCHVMHPYHLRALAQSLERDGDRARHAVGRVGRVAERADEALARGAEEDRAAEAVQQRRGRGSARGCGRRVLPKPMPGSTRMRARGMPAASAAATRASRIVEDVEEHVVVGGRVLHRLRVALRVHQADRAAGGSGDGEAVGIVGERRDVVEEVGAGVEGGAGHGGVAGVDRDRQRRSPRRAARRSPGRRGRSPRRAARGRRRGGSTRRRCRGCRRRPRPWRGRRASAPTGARCRPPSEKLSGVTLRTPMIRGRSSARPQTGGRGAVEALGDLGRQRGGGDAAAAARRGGARRPRRTRAGRRRAAGRPAGAGRRSAGSAGSGRLMPGRRPRAASATRRAAPSERAPEVDDALGLVEAPGAVGRVRDRGCRSARRSRARARPARAGDAGEMVDERAADAGAAGLGRHPDRLEEGDRAGRRSRWRRGAGSSRRSRRRRAVAARRPRRAPRRGRAPAMARGSRRAARRAASSGQRAWAQSAQSSRSAGPSSRIVERHAAFHLIEQPIDGICSRGPWPVSATCRIASKSSRRAPGCGSRPLSSSRPRYCSFSSALKPKKSGVQAAP